MKYTIHGFDQLTANKLGLTNDDLLILRWFVDFSNTKKMKTIIEQDGVYYWVIYSQILQDLPILKISKDRLKKKHFNNLCDSGVLKHKHIKEGGSFSYYAIGENYLGLVENNEGGQLKMTEGSVKNDLPNNNILNNSINNNNIYNNIINYLNQSCNKHYKSNIAKTKKLIDARIKEGFTEDDFKKVIDNKKAQWLNDEKMNQYLRPETLFGTKFESYLNTETSNNNIKDDDLI